MTKPVKKSKNKTVRLLLKIALIIALPFIAVFVFTFFKTLFSSDKTSETEIVQEEPKVGDSLSGITHKEIVTEYKKHKQSSQLASTNYINSLAGEKVIWIGTAMNVRADWVNGEQYMVVSFTSNIFDTNLAYVNVETNEEYQKIPDMTLIKVSGEIDRIEPFLETGINIYFEEATIEIIE